MQWWSFSTPNFFHGSESFLANSFWYITCFPIKIPTRVIWWRVVFWKDASKQRNVGLNSNNWGNILYIYQLRVSLRQTFFALQKPQHHDDIGYCIPPPSSVTWWSHTGGDAAGVSASCCPGSRWCTTGLSVRYYHWRLMREVLADCGVTLFLKMQK